MKTFTQYVALRESESDLEPVGKEPQIHNPFASNSDSNMKLLHQIIKMAFERHLPDTKRFLTELASKDEDIKDLVDELDSQGLSNMSSKTDRFKNDDKDYDEIVPSTADGGGDGGLEPGD